MKRWKALLAEKLLEFTADYRSRVHRSDEQLYEPERIIRLPGWPKTLASEVTSYISGSAIGLMAG